MSNGSKLLRALIEGIVSSLSKGSSKSGRSDGSSTRTTAPIQAKWRESQGASKSAGSASLNEHADSPGREGSGATRDLTPAELRSMRPSYAPKLDGEPDPGEVIWTWVPYVENDGRGKDRPVLIIARLDEASWAACYLSTKEHRDFVSVGSGSWDSQGRESFLSPERVLRVTDEGMRRESTGIDRSRFDQAVQAVMRWHGIG